MILRDRIFELDPTSAVETGFSVGEYLKSRTENPDFVMIEIGHGCLPVAFQQQPFEDKRAYIGIEAWLRNPYDSRRQRVEELRQSRGDQNIFFLDQDIGGTLFEDYGDGSTEYSGPYGTETILPDEAADEVFLGNVFGDPHVAYTKGTGELIKESARLVKIGGFVVLRETISPQRLQLTLEQIETTGLSITKIVTQEDGKNWQALEDTYAAYPNDLSHYKNQYIFLGKTSF